MEINTNLSIITFQCHKWMKVLQNQHGLQRKAIGNGICTALKTGIPVTVCTIKSDGYSQ